MNESEDHAGKKRQRELVEALIDCVSIANLPVDEFIKKIHSLDGKQLIALLAFFKGYYDTAEKRVDSGGLM